MGSEAESHGGEGVWTTGRVLWGLGTWGLTARFSLPPDLGQHTPLCYGRIMGTTWVRHVRVPCTENPVGSRSLPSSPGLALL